MIVLITEFYSRLLDAHIVLTQNLLKLFIFEAARYFSWMKRLHPFIKQAGYRSDSILKLSLEKSCYNFYPQGIIVVLQLR